MADAKRGHTPCPYDEGEVNHPMGIDGKACALCRHYLHRAGKRSVTWVLQRKARVTRWANLLGETDAKKDGKPKAKVVSIAAHRKRA